MAQAPAPAWIHRWHTPAALHALDFPHPLLAAGDGSGRVSVSDVRTARPLAVWQAHEASILGVKLWGRDVVTHGRDNLLRVWALPIRDEQAGSSLPPRDVASLPRPTVRYEVEVNALNYCPFSLLPLSRADSAELRRAMGWQARAGQQVAKTPQQKLGEEPEALVAVPHTLEAAYIDVYHLPSCSRIATAIGAPDVQTKGSKDLSNRPGIAMSVHLFRRAKSKDGEAQPLSVLVGYEDGKVKLWELRALDVGGSSAKMAWTLAWEERVHTEAVMAVALSEDLSFAVSVSADQRVVRYDLGQVDGARTLMQRTNHEGRASVCIRADGKLIATGGWDGSIRLYAVEELRGLGKLSYHRESVQALAFARQSGPGAAADSLKDADSSDSEEDEDALGPLAHHSTRSISLAAGGKEGRVSLWDLQMLSI